MTFKLLALTFWGAYGFAGPMAAADVPNLPLKLQGNVNLDTIAEQTHGALKWRNGAFLYMDAASTPVFHTLDRTGRLLSSATVEVPGESQFWVADFDRGTDGSVIFAGGVYSASGRGAPLIAWLSPDGHTERVIRTAPYYTHMLSIAPDGTLWTIGCEMIDHKSDVAGLDPNAGVLRHLIVPASSWAPSSRNHNTPRATNPFGWNQDISSRKTTASVGTRQAGEVVAGMSKYHSIP